MHANDSTENTYKRKASKKKKKRDSLLSIHNLCENKIYLMDKHSKIGSRIGLEEHIGRTQYSIHEILSFPLRKKHSFWWKR